MRDLGSIAQGCFVTMMLLGVFVLNGQVRAEQRSAPWDASACNETCRWWMGLGGKPAADVRPPPSEPSQALSAKAIVSDADLTAAASPALGVTGTRGSASEDHAARVRPPARLIAVLALLPPERPAYIPGQSLWGVQILGSQPALPAQLIASP